mmetsp:Transcript_43198/g.49667  ORF Transcript_43198/g.49667 Transcript_43198/m.49667 type:complete len:422 (-) Transcript_43198:243-1508(-)
MGNIQTGCCEFRRRDQLLTPRESTGEPTKERRSVKKEKEDQDSTKDSESSPRRTRDSMTRGHSGDSALDTIVECSSSERASTYEMITPCGSIERVNSHTRQAPIIPQLNLKKAIEMNAKKMAQKHKPGLAIPVQEQDINSYPVGDGLTDHSDIDEDECLNALDSPCFSARDTDRVSKDLDILRDFSCHNVETLIKLLDSDSPVQITIPLHAWAKSPTCMGALACVHLLLLGNKLEAEGKEGEQQDFINSLKRNGIVDKIIGFLESGQRDKEDAGLILLNLITNSGSITIPKDIIEHLMKLLKSSPHVSKMVTIASIIDELSHNSDYWKQRVMEEGSIQIILEYFEAIDPNDVELILIFLTDILMGNDGMVVQERVNLFKVLNLDEMLQEMIENDAHAEETIEEARNLRGLLKPRRKLTRNL